MDPQIVGKKPFVHLSLLAFALAIIGGAIQLITMGGYPLIEGLIFVAVIVISISAFVQIKRISGRGKAWAIIAIILSLGGFFNIAAQYIVEDRIETFQQEGAQEKMRQVGAAMNSYKKDMGVCPDSLEQLAPDYISSTDIFYDSKGNKIMQYKLSADKQNCEVFYGASFGVGL